ncbi:hypothetical protein [Candidatus Kuenenia sp.]|uniref:hypothetical protein n=1 Tax=Candidatus Kuenenia sp. TaxID=2499824 RepID=UPI0032206DF8
MDGQSEKTDSDGAVTFSLETGDYAITVSLAGYDTEIVAVTLAAPVTIQAVGLSLSACPNVSEVTATTASVPPDELEVAKGDSEDVVITATDDNGCPAAGVKVKKRLLWQTIKRLASLLSAQQQMQVVR